MEKNEWYVLTNPLSHQVLLRDLNFFYDTLSSVPENILLLNQRTALGQFDEYIKFHVISGRDKVEKYFKQQRNGRRLGAQWVDFESLSLLHQLHPQELAELLYLKHMTIPLNSPFYYKLRNQFVYLPVGPNVVKIYYRSWDVFYHQFARALCSRVELGLGERRMTLNWKKNNDVKNSSVCMPSTDILMALSDFLREGVVLDFSQIQPNQKHVEVPIYLAEDHLETSIKHRPNLNQLGTLTYHRGEKNWTLD